MTLRAMWYTLSALGSKELTTPYIAAQADFGIKLEDDLQDHAPMRVCRVAAGSCLALKTERSPQAQTRPPCFVFNNFETFLAFTAHRRCWSDAIINTSLATFNLCGDVHCTTYIAQDRIYLGCSVYEVSQ